MSMAEKQSQQIQTNLAAHIRNPAKHSATEIGVEIEARRLKIYRDLIFNNVESFVAGGFPVLRSLYSEPDWLALIQAFLDQHACHTPYFLEISQEFLSFLQHRPEQDSAKPFLLELAHYEWVELALDTSDVEEPKVDSNGDLLTGLPIISALAWSLAYQFPVHELGPACQPSEVPEQATYLVVYRDREFSVQFMLINAATSRLLALLAEPQIDSGQAAIDQLAGEMGMDDASSIQAFASDLLYQLRQANILIGTQLAS